MLLSNLQLFKLQITVITQISAAFGEFNKRCGTYSRNYCNWQLESLLHLGQIVTTFRTKCYYYI